MIDVYEIIKSINEEKKKKKLHPTSALFSEITAAVAVAVKKEINELVKSKRIVFHQTINSLSFDAVEDNDSNGNEP